MFIDRKDAVTADIETTGLDTAKDEAFQIGAQRFRGDEPIMPAGEWLLRPTCPMSDEAEKVHGYSLKMLEDKPYFLAVAQKVQTYLHPKLLHVVYNGLSLDVPILQRQFKEVGYTWHPDIVDVFAFVCWHLRHLPSGERKLEAIAKRLGMEVPNSHDALADARTTASVLFRLQNDGIVPLTAAEALRQSHQFSTVHRQEFDAWKWYFYARPDFAKPLSPDTVELRIGFGKHHGKRVAQVVPSYFAFMLDAGYMGGAPEEVVQWFRQLAAGRQPDCQNHPVLQLVKELVSALVKAAAPPALPEPPAAVEPAEQRGLAAEVTKAQVDRWLDLHGWNLFGSDTGAGPATFVWRHPGDTDRGVQHDLVMQPENFAYIAETHGLTPEQLLAEVKTKAGNVEMPDPAQLEAWLALKGWSWVERFQGWHVKVNGPGLPVFKRHSNVAQISWKPRDGINKELLEALVELYELGSVDGLLKNVAATEAAPARQLLSGVHGPGLVAAHAAPDSWSGAELPTAGQFTVCRMSWEASRQGSADTLLSEMPGTLRWLIEEGGPMVGAIAWELERNRDGLGLIVLTIPEEPVLDTLQLQELADKLWRAANAKLPALETGEWAAIVKEQGDRPLEQVMTIQVEVRQHGKGSEGNWTGFVKGGHPAPGPGEHPELAALVFGWRGNPKLARFGTTQRHASVIDRLCSCGAHAAGKAIDATLSHLDGCKAVVCTDEYPHIADPCPVCESTPEEFQEYLSSSRNAVHNEILARAKLKKVRAELADKISAITDKGEAAPADLSSQYRGTAILMSELLLPEIQQRAVKYIAPGSAVTVQPTEAQPESPESAMTIFPSGSYEETNQTLLQAGKYMVGGEVVTVPPGRTLPIPSLSAAGIPVIVSPYVDHPTPMDLGDGPVVVTPSKEAAIEAVQAYNARQQPEQSLTFAGTPGEGPNPYLDMMKIKAGTVVRKIGGNIPMTCAADETEEGNIKCTWFDDDAQVHEDVFAVADIEVITHQMIVDGMLNQLTQLRRDAKAAAELAAAADLTPTGTED